MSFGAPTWGVPSANATVQLSDGAAMFLTVAEMSDRTGRTYGSMINPDYEIAAEFSGPNDATVRAALEWLQSARTGVAHT